MLHWYLLITAIHILLQLHVFEYAQWEYIGFGEKRRNMCNGVSRYPIITP